MPERGQKYKVAISAVRSVANLLVALKEMKCSDDAFELALALHDAQRLTRSSKLPDDVKQAVDDAVSVACECYVVARKQGRQAEKQEKEKDDEERKRRRTRVAYVSKTILLEVVCLACVVALLRSPFPYVSCVPLVLFADALGFKRPLRACASVLKAFKKTR